MCPDFSLIVCERYREHVSEHSDLHANRNVRHMSCCHVHDRNAEKQHWCDTQPDTSEYRD